MERFADVGSERGIAGLGVGLWGSKAVVPLNLGALGWDFRGAIEMIVDRREQDTVSGGDLCPCLAWSRRIDCKRVVSGHGGHIDDGRINAVVGVGVRVDSVVEEGYRRIVEDGRAHV